MGNKYNWLFGENIGKTANNNSFYLWRYIVDHHFDDVNAVFIAEKNKSNLARYKELNPEERARFIWRNSLGHIRLFNSADLLFVSLSFRDVKPDHISIKKYEPKIMAPLVYLQHGTLAMKRLGYKNYYADNSMLRFVYYNQNIPEKLQSLNEFKEYQLFDGIYHPRYSELARRSLNRKQQNGKKILWFITWREYFGDNSETFSFLTKVKSVLRNGRFASYCKENNGSITVCLHSQFTDDQVKSVRKAVQGLDARIVYAQDVDVMDLIVEHDLLITDYSSVGFDFTFLGKPVILFQPDVAEYTRFRELYCTLEELEKVNVEKTSELIDILVGEHYSINPFFTINIPDQAELPEIAGGKYNERFFRYFYHLEQNSIAFLGYDFSGIGGSVFATRALMEGLLESGYLVRAYTLKQVLKFNVPAGLSLKPATRQYGRKLSDKLLQKLVFSRHHYSYLDYDPSKESMRPLAGAMMTNWMKNIHANTVVSTRESLHLFLSDASSPFIHKRIYFFHTASELVESLFPGVLAELQRRGIENAVFVTENNKKNLAEINHFNNYHSSCVIGNSLDSSRSLTCQEIKEKQTSFNSEDNATIIPTVKDNRIHCLYMTRISHERAESFDNMLQFARFLKESRIDNVVIDLYGTGDYQEKITDQIDEEELSDYIEYHGQTTNIKQTISKENLLVDFSDTQSFGMTYIEGILNGKMVLCRHNEGADEVLSFLPEAFYGSNEELLDKIYRYQEAPVDLLLNNYNQVREKYGRATVTEKFIQGNGINPIDTDSFLREEKA